MPVSWTRSETGSRSRESHSREGSGAAGSRVCIPGTTWLPALATHCAGFPGEHLPSAATLCPPWAPPAGSGWTVRVRPKTSRLDRSRSACGPLMVALANGAGVSQPLRCPPAPLTPLQASCLYGALDAVCPVPCLQIPALSQLRRVTFLCVQPCPAPTHCEPQMGQNSRMDFGKPERRIHTTGCHLVSGLGGASSLSRRCATSPPPTTGPEDLCLALSPSCSLPAPALPGSTRDKTPLVALTLAAGGREEPAPPRDGVQPAKTGARADAPTQGLLLRRTHLHHLPADGQDRVTSPAGRPGQPAQLRGLRPRLALLSRPRPSRRTEPPWLRLCWQGDKLSHCSWLGIGTWHTPHSWPTPQPWEGRSRGLGTTVRLYPGMLPPGTDLVANSASLLTTDSKKATSKHRSSSPPAQRVSACF